MKSTQRSASSATNHLRLLQSPTNDMKLALALLSSMFLSAGANPANAADAKPSGVPSSYPLTKCPVSDEVLGEMGKPVKVSHQGTDVYLCCKSCIKDFDKEPAKYVEKVKNASKK